MCTIGDVLPFCAKAHALVHLLAHLPLPCSDFPIWPSFLRLLWPLGLFHFSLLFFFFSHSSYSFHCYLSIAGPQRPSLFYVP